nr:MAG TPA: hypothetical protein [Caudoviricetes sp.]DAP85379.1 MAG TPA: hypothetical protein [Caudoviricetes sp.]
MAACFTEKTEISINQSGVQFGHRSRHLAVFDFLRRLQGGQLSSFVQAVKQPEQLVSPINIHFSAPFIL